MKQPSVVETAVTRKWWNVLWRVLHKTLFIVSARRWSVGLWQLSHSYARWTRRFSPLLDRRCQPANMVCTSQLRACCQSRDTQDRGLAFVDMSFRHWFL